MKGAWRWALLASLGGHGLVLGLAFLGESSRPGAPPAPAVTATEVSLTRVALASLGPRAAGAPVLPAQPVADGAPPARVAAPVPASALANEAPPPVPEAAAQALAPTAGLAGVAPATAEEEATPAGEGLGPGELAAVPGGSGSPGTGTAPSPGGDAPTAGQAAGSDGLERLVHARLAAAALRCYPQAARRFAVSGTAQVSFCTREDGATRDARLSASSGAPLLDSAATGCVVASASPLPLEAASRCFTVPVHFSAR